MSRLIVVAVFMAFFVCPVPASASLPYYNQNLGYTIWLTDGWSEAPDALLSRFSGFFDGVTGHMAGWKAGYTLEGASSASLLVSEIHGRVVSKESIGNFNQFVVRGLERLSRARSGNAVRVRLKAASFDARRNWLRLNLDTTDPAGRAMTAIVYIIYTSTGMLKFVGLAEPGDLGSVHAIDEAVSTLYLDYGLRQ